MVSEEKDKEIPVISETNIAIHTSMAKGLNIVKRDESRNSGFRDSTITCSVWKETVKSIMADLSGVIVKSPITRSILFFARPWTIIFLS